MEHKEIILKSDREYRNFSFRVLGEAPEDKIIEGYAVLFDEPTVLYSAGEIDYKEVVDRNAFDGVDMSNVVLNFNHGGKPVARTKNKTLELNVDDKGLRIRADLSGTQEGREMYEEIKGGYLDNMSFAFTVREKSYDQETHTERILKVDRLYDTAVVDFPAYENTSVYARKRLKAVAENEMKAVADEMQKRKARLILEIKSKL